MSLSKTEIKQKEMMMIILVSSVLAKQITLEEAKRNYETTRNYLRKECDYIDKTNLEDLIGSGFIIELISGDKLIFPKPI